jgi:integrase
MKRHKRGKPERVIVGNVAVRIYHRLKGGYLVWEVADYSDGHRRLRSFSDHAEARREARRIAQSLASGETTAAQMRGPDAASYGRAVELLRPIGDPLELAVVRYAEAVGIVGDGGRLAEAAKFWKERNPDAMPTRTVRQAVDELLELKRSRGKSARYLEDLKSRLGRFAAAFEVNVADVRAADVQAWFDKLKVAPRTLLNFRRASLTLFEFAQARGYIGKGENPIAATEAVELGNGGAIAIYSPGECTKLLQAAPADFVPCLAVCAFAGLRSAEAERLDWADVDLASGFITVAPEKAKTRSRRLVSISTNLSAWLEPHRKARGALWHGSHPLYYGRQRQTAQASGVTWKPNALRHSFISYRLAQVQDAARVALEAGNSPGMVFRHYRELVRPEVAAEWFEIKPDAREGRA